ncbi:MAG: acyl-CoA thioesterase [Actinomycetota bacterium]|nr:acyl-CoA thioesterase [Actinomycetota bacterium]
MSHEKRVEIRWHDVDAYRHVNNAVFLTYLEECRDEWLERLLGRSDELWDFVLGRVEIDYRQELTHEDDAVIVRCTLASVGNSSVRTTEQILKLDGSVSAEAGAVLVALDRVAKRPRPLTAQERAALQRTPAEWW